MPRHLGLSDSEKVERAVIAGDPDRIRAFAEHVGGETLLSTKRGYVAYRIQHQGLPIHLVAHGIGSPSLAICVNELIDLGLSRVIRVGSAGTLSDAMSIGDVFVPLDAIGEDGVSKALLASGHSLRPDDNLASALYQTIAKGKARAHRGTILSSDLYYTHGLKNLADPAASGAQAIEMECAALFGIARARGVAAAAALVIDGNPTKWTEGVFDNRPATLGPVLLEALEAALAALTS